MMSLYTRNDPFSGPSNGDSDNGQEDGSLPSFARILAFLFAAVLIWILYRVVSGAWRQYQKNGSESLFGRRRGAYKRIPSLRLHRPEEDEGYRDTEEEPEVDATIEGRGKARAVDVEVVDEGYHDGESSLEMDRAGVSPAKSADVWKEQFQRK